MPLNTPALQNSILAALKRNRQEEDAETAVQNLAADITNAIEAYIKSGTVTVTVTGIVTAGNQNTQTQTAPVQAIGTPPATGGIT